MSNKRYNINLQIIGCKVGATSIIKRFCNKEFEKKPLHQDFYNIIIENFKINVWDHCIPNYYYIGIPAFILKNFDGIIMVYDITNIKSFNFIKTHWYQEYLKEKSNNENEVMDNKKKIYDHLMIIGTKSDERDKSNFKECVNSDAARDYAHSIGALFFEVSSKENLNINESFNELINKIKLNYNQNGEEILQYSIINI
ncbi:hypothetical protein DICPUDRAFT_75757 [Dictyostelium purpureum]|uniref:Uncharacterized protein n=1 Tax=Dictyostelium purpureum TaxID=5786 RepID=F0ZBL0_DICPU|nr:uncharacterized protein DICPUDRAFT_75757 [Dictyostelium purpureum]EGC38711.1 hypothetical protein DICPUDRAFT_75757 [Dictyostelium purpureum]|eukprot:XP_003284807.1 hypothetical protein DICPUDRAFT_75757 [Dictyostelium purpureum]